MGSGYSINFKDKYTCISYNNKKCIQGLLRFYYALKVTNEFNPNFELVCILIDIDNSLCAAELTTKQKIVINLYMKGFTEKQIGKKLNITQQAVNKHINLTCKKISDYLFFNK
ncbi:sigma factor-like helix-turn-helix DNA-binding protein [Abyssisolibacter fermentans]|uniref:sigma factor-like helix-turn-helix DNA-binding protein n=1 Tax=Abyssisolibacter fermentans TaxID=1766203 RepID=UPI00082F6FA2|nr:sigma factor-like helix-turn-helix DNA-binding protein [Abyssisolibacter fermentans]